MSRRLRALAALVLAAAAAAGPARAATVDMELLLLADSSFSISAAEFTQQRLAYSGAFRSDSVQAKIADGRIGAIAAQLVYWGQNQIEAVAWRLVTTPDRVQAFRDDQAYAAVPDAHILTADQFADAIDAYNGGAKPNVGSYTHLENALQYGAAEFGINGGSVFESTRRVIDISGDGPDNEGLGLGFLTSSAQKLARAQAVRAAAVAAIAAGVTEINAIAILGDGLFGGYAPSGATDMQIYYEVYLKAPVDTGFVVVSDGFTDFAPQLEAKILRELDAIGWDGLDPEIVPAPPALALLGLALAALAALRRRPA